MKGVLVDDSGRVIGSARNQHDAKITGQNWLDRHPKYVGAVTYHDTRSGRETIIRRRRPTHRIRSSDWGE